MAITNTKSAAEEKTRTVFSKMVNDDGQLFPDYVIRQEAVNFMIAGVDTTAMTLTYLVYAVLANTTGNIKRKLLQELSTGPSRPSWKELEQYQYLNCIVNETLRLYDPVSGTLPRMPPIDGVVLGPYKIPATTLVMTQAYTFHTDSSVFDEPFIFKPERWGNPTPQMKQHFMPFGGTGRLCLGQNTAKLEILHAVTRLFLECPDIKLAVGTDAKSMKPLEFFVAKPQGMKCEIARA